MAHPTVSIVVLTKNAEPYLSETLEAIFSQETDFSFEVLVIDSGSKDRSLEILKDYSVRLIEIPPESFNHGDTRNLGARQADPGSRYIVYLSQDALPQNEAWLQNLIIPMEADHQVAGVFSRHIPRPESSPAQVR